MGYTSRTYERHDGSVHLSCAETAKLIRKALKAAFPTTKFSVRSDSYANGASVHVSWNDGPTTRQVDRVAGVYSGAGFDGMVDLKTYNEHWIEPDGTVKIARSGGQGSTVPETITDPPSAEARLVSLGADFVLTQRSLSPETMARIEQEIADFLGEPYPKDGEHSAQLPANAFRIGEHGSGISWDPEGGTWASNLVWRIGALRDYATPCECPATERYYTRGGVARCGGCGA